jgi:hypothetical protein
LILVIIAVAVPYGVIFSIKNAPLAPPPPRSSSSTSSISTISSIPQPTRDPNYAIGVELSPLYASKDGAFNSTGIIIALADFGAYSSILVFY